MLRSPLATTLTSLGVSLETLLTLSVRLGGRWRPPGVGPPLGPDAPLGEVNPLGWVDPLEEAGLSAAC